MTTSREEAERAAIAALVRKSPTKLVVLDDDPTGTQTVHGLDVLTDWSEHRLRAALTDSRPCFYILTNSRSLPAAAAIAMTRDIIGSLQRAAAGCGRSYTVVSRSDSTLRGHFAEEVGELLRAQPGCDGVIVAPVFFEAGRITRDDVHYVREGDRWIPAAETEFARDVTFGYGHSNLKDWIEEKTRGAVKKSSVVSVPIEALRADNGAEVVRDRLMGIPSGSYVAVNAADYADLAVFVHGLLLAEAAGRRFVYRTAASFVQVRAAIEPNPLLRRSSLRASAGSGGLVVVGSYTGKTTAQLELALRLPGMTPVEVNVGQLGTDRAREAEITRVADAARTALQAGKTCIVYTSRAVTTELGRAGDLAVAQTVSGALVEIVRAIDVRPRFVVAKGGITSSDVAVHGLGVKQALILGQIEQGIPVWRLGPEGRFPGMDYVVFPGNVGGPETLAAILKELA